MSFWRTTLGQVYLTVDPIIVQRRMDAPPSAYALWFHVEMPDGEWSCYLKSTWDAMKPVEPAVRQLEKKTGYRILNRKEAIALWNARYAGYHYQPKDFPSPRMQLGQSGTPFWVLRDLLRQSEGQQTRRCLSCKRLLGYRDSWRGCYLSRFYNPATNWGSASRGYHCSSICRKRTISCRYKARLPYMNLEEELQWMRRQFKACKDFLKKKNMDVFKDLPEQLCPQ